MAERSGTLPGNFKDGSRAPVWWHRDRAGASSSYRRPRVRSWTPAGRPAVVVGHFGEHGVIFLLALVREDDTAAEQAVFEHVLRRAIFAGVGPGTGAELGIGAIRGDLGGGGHFGRS